MTQDLRKMLIFPTIGIILLLIVFISAFTFFLATNFSDEVANESTRRAALGVQSYVETFERDTLVAANILANDENVLRLIREGYRTELLEYLIVMKEILRMDYFLVFDRNAQVLVRTLDPDRYGDTQVVTAFERAYDGYTFFSYHSSPTIPFALQHSIPLIDDGEFIGVIASGFLLSDPALINDMSQRFGAELTFYFGNTAVVSTFRALDGEYEVLANPLLVEAAIQNGESMVVDAEIGYETYRKMSFPLINSDGEVMGFVSTAFSMEGLNIEHTMIAGIVLIGVALMIVAIIFLIYIVRKISRPVFEANERMWLMFNSSPTSIFFFDRDLNAIDCNTKALEMFGFSNKKEALENYRDTLPARQPDGEDSAALFKSLIEKAFATGETSYEMICQRKDGTPLATKTTFVRMRQNDIEIVAQYTQDLSAILEAEEKIQEAFNFNQIVLDSAPYMIVLRNSKFEVVRINQVGLDLMQVESQEQYIREWRTLSPLLQQCGTPSDEWRTAKIDEVVANGYANFVWTFQNKIDKELIPMEMTLVKINYLGEDMVVSYAFDLRPAELALQQIFEREQQAKIAERESRAKSRFLAQISHEIRTPMNAVLGIAEIQLQNENLPRELKDSLSHIRTSSYLLLAIINNLLDLSKAEAGKMEIINRPYETVSLIVDTMQVNMFYIGSKQIDFIMKINEDLPVYLLGDELRIKQILNNCLSNSLKYTTEGSVSLIVDAVWDKSVAINERTEVTLIFRIIDTGRGMSQAQVRQLFSEEYVRFDEFDSIEGSGLGMMITYQLTTMMNGTINVTSELGKGTEVELRIPQKIVGHGIIGKEQAQKLESFELSQIAKLQVADFIRKPMPYGRVLIVDDVELNLYVAKGHLAPYRLQVDTALSGFETIDKIKSGETYDIIFMDHMMPEMDGIETVHKLREDGYEGVIVALTANALVGNAELFKQQGFDGFVSKPIDIRELNQVLVTFVSERHKEEAEKFVDEIRQVPIDDSEGSSQIQVTHEMARIFQREAEKAIVTLQETYANGNIKLLITTVHAMKSALAYLGELDLSMSAAALESAGKSGDSGYIDDNLNHFVVALEALLHRLQSSFPMVDLKSKKKGDMENLAKQLKVIEAACDDYDVKTAIAALESLMEQAWSDEISGSLQKMHDLLFLDSDFDLIAEMIKDFNV